MGKGNSGNYGGGWLESTYSGSRRKGKEKVKSWIVYSGIKFLCSRKSIALGSGTCRNKMFLQHIILYPVLYIQYCLPFTFKAFEKTAVLETFSKSEQQGNPDQQGSLGKLRAFEYPASIFKFPGPWRFGNCGIMDAHKTLFKKFFRGH